MSWLILFAFLILDLILWWAIRRMQRREKGPIDQALHRELAIWHGKSFADLSATTFPVAYDSGEKGEGGSRTEVSILKRSATSLHIRVAVDGGDRRELAPASGRFIATVEAG